MEKKILKTIKIISISGLFSLIPFHKLNPEISTINLLQTYPIEAQQKNDKDILDNLNKNQIIPKKEIKNIPQLHKERKERNNNIKTKEEKQIIKIETENWKTYQNSYFGFSIKHNPEFQKLKSVNGNKNTEWIYKYRFKKKNNKNGFEIKVYQNKKDINNCHKLEHTKYNYCLIIQKTGNIPDREIQEISKTIKTQKIKRQEQTNNNFVQYLTLGGEKYVHINPYYKKFVKPPTRSKPCFDKYLCDPDGDPPKKGSKNKKYFDDCNLDYGEIPHPYCIYKASRWNKVIGREPEILSIAKKFYLSHGNLKKPDIKKLRKMGKK